MNQWIQHNFFHTKRAKCLILIGPTGTGKTSFALSLPGRANYFQDRWNLDKWNNYARYSVYDDIPWDDFSKLNFPSKKNLLTQKWNKISVRAIETSFFPSFIIVFFFTSIYTFL
jgi:septin family protein